MYLGKLNCGKKGQGGAGTPQRRNHPSRWSTLEDLVSKQEKFPLPLPPISHMCACRNTPTFETSESNRKRNNRTDIVESIFSL